MKSMKLHQFVLISVVLMMCLFLKRIQKPDLRMDKPLDRMAIALKTGKEVALQRVPIQLITFLKPVSSLLVIGDHVGTVGAHAIHNVCSPLVKRSSERVYENQSSIGWIQDAQKNIPGYVQLYHAFPEKEWYVMMDDDTFLFFDNLLEFLSSFDPGRPWYFGLSTNFIGCDQIVEYGKGPLFAHGGSGIVLSKRALELMLTKSEECIAKYSGCWAGDVRLALCLRDVGVHIDGRGEFHENPPNDEMDYPDPCARPLSFHHLLPHQSQMLFDAIQKHPKVTMSDLAAHFLSKEIQMDKDRPGMDYRRFYQPSGHGCYEQCLKDSRCVAFSFYRSECKLKNGIPKQERVIGAMSGVVVDHFHCQ
jgi:hypothetical protein